MTAWLSEAALAQALADYGYWAVGTVVALESLGLPLPGETVLVAASLYAGATGRLDPAGVVAAASVGAIIGDNIGYWIGRRLGYPLLLAVAPKLGIEESHIKVARFLFDRYGGGIVFFGRFFAILRALAALLAGVNRMRWSHFLLCNAGGAVLWASLFGFGADLLGEAVTHMAGRVAVPAALIAVAVLAIAGFAIRRAGADLIVKAEQAYPGPLTPR